MIKVPVFVCTATFLGTDTEGQRDRGGAVFVGSRAGDVVPGLQFWGSIMEGPGAVAVAVGVCRRRLLFHRLLTEVAGEGASGGGAGGGAGGRGG